MPSGHIELYQLRCFEAVAKELNFRRAAEQLNMTQPPLSRQIKLLEHSIGVELFERSNRSVRLTPAGISLLSSAKDILERSEQAVLRSRHAARGAAGELRIGSVPSTAIEVLPQLIGLIQRELPDVVIEPSELMSYEIVEQLRSREIDFGLTRNVSNATDISSMLVLTEDFIVAMPMDHPLSNVPNLTLEHLDNQRFIGYSTFRGGFLNRAQMAMFAVAHVKPKVVLEVAQTQTVLAMVNQGLGLALVPKSSVAQSMSNLCFRELVAGTTLKSELFLCHLRVPLSPLNERIKEMLIEQIGLINLQLKQPLETY